MNVYGKTRIPMNMKSTSISALAVAILLSFALSDSIASEGPKADFPEMKVGAVYTFTKGRNKNLAYEIKSVQPDGRFVVDITDQHTFKVVREVFDRNFTNRRNIKDTGGYNYMLDFPLFTGKKWTDNPTIITPLYSSRISVTYKYHVKGYEDVKVGKYSVKAYRVDIRSVGNDGKGTIWYSPEMGFVVKEDINIYEDRNGWANKNRMTMVDYKPPSQPVAQMTGDVSASQKADMGSKGYENIPIEIVHPSGISNPDAIAVVIGNKDYADSDIPPVDFAINDAEMVAKYLINILGYKEGNVMLYKNATQARIASIFGNASSHKGKLYNWLKKGKSDIFVYYSGHGAPDPDSKQGYFVPVDADPQAIAFTGYPLEVMYGNLAKVSSELESPNVTIVIDACFSGASEGGMLLKNASPIFIETKNTLMDIPNAVVLTSASGAEISSWYPEKKYSMFTYFFLDTLRASVGENR